VETDLPPLGGEAADFQCDHPGEDKQRLRAGSGWSIVSHPALDFY
jgi:hypothetical protein